MIYSKTNKIKIDLKKKNMNKLQKIDFILKYQAYS